MATASLLRPASHNPTIYITGLQSNVTIQDLADKFGSIGRIKVDKRSGDPKIYVYSDKATNVPKGDGTVTFEDPNAASAAVDWFNGTDFMGCKITVQLAEEKEYIPPNRGAGRGRQDYSGPYGDSRSTSYSARDRYGVEADESPEFASYDGGQYRANTSGYRGGNRGDVSGEWDCPNCNNMNFAKRTECFKCHSPRPASADQHQQSFKLQAMPNFANPGDWTCKACANVNWARRNTCNRCNAPKPTAVVEKRTGRGGGYNEREDSRERYEPASSFSRDYRSSERSYRNEANYDHVPRPDSYPDPDYGYGSRDRPSPYLSHNDSLNSRSSSYRQDSGYRRDRSRSPRRY